MLNLLDRRGLVQRQFRKWRHSMKKLLFPSMLMTVAGLMSMPVAAQSRGVVATPSASSAPAAAPHPASHKHRHLNRVQNGHYATPMRHHARASHRPSDSIANRLNRDELRNLSGSTMPRAAAFASPPSAGDLMAPGALRGAYGQPSPTQGIPGGNQPSASSHAPN